MSIKFVFTIAVITILSTISIYVYQFGLGLWSEHSKWAEFGSFMGGVLGPILAFFSLLYLAIQLEMQWKENKEARIQAELKHREDYIALNMSLFTSKLIQQDLQLNAPFSEIILKIHRDNVYKKQVSELIKVGLSARAETLVMWVNIASALSFLKSVDEDRYTQQLTMVSVQVGYELCKGLDEVIHLATGIDFEHHFGDK
ncbi:hypothetical protein [Vibrio gigantis]|uniref:hypothetical protein n=1 Tax=Vibrio gigantis TaxID=296199 RepID=UPI0035A5CCFF